MANPNSKPPKKPPPINPTNNFISINPVLCLNPTCTRAFKNAAALSHHYQQSPHCHPYLYKSLQQNQSKPQDQRKRKAGPLTTSHPDFAPCTLDYDTSSDESIGNGGNRKRKASEIESTGGADFTPMPLEYSTDGSEEEDSVNVAAAASDCDTFRPQGYRDYSSEEESGFSVSTADTEDLETYADHNRPPRQYLNKSGQHILYTEDEKIELKLLKLLNDNHCKHTLFKDIMQWATYARREGYEFKPQRMTRDAQLRNLGKRMQHQHLEPKCEILKLPAGPAGPLNDHVPITTFDFEAMLFTLLSDPVLVSDPAKLDINPEDPFGRYKSADGRLSAANSGEWYDQAFEHHCKNPDDFLCPIILACDEAAIAQGKKHSVCPINFTLSIFNEELRGQEMAWRPLGYVYDLSIIENLSTEYKPNKKNPKGTTEVKMDRYQAIIKAVVAGIVECQKGGKFDHVPLTIANQTKHVNLKIAVMFIVGDIQGGDKLCGVTVAYGNTLERPCRKCNVKGSQLGDPDVDCHRISMKKVAKWIEEGKKKHLKKICQHPIRPAIFDLDYGGCRFGCFSAACCTEVLHAVDNGLIETSLRCLYNQDLSSKDGQRRLDGVTRILAHLPRQRNFSAGTDPGMPRLRWRDGITSLTNVSAVYKVGMMFTIVIVALTKEGQKVFDDTMGEDRRVDMQYAFQMLLCYRQWLKKPSYWKKGNQQAREDARDSIRAMLHELIEFWPRLKGNGWEIPKVHEQLHIPDDIDRHGCPNNTITTRTEHHHIQEIKKPFLRTQKRRETLDYQIAKRRSETYLIDRAWAAMNQFQNDDDISAGTRGSVHDRQSGSYGIVEARLPPDPASAGDATFVVINCSSTWKLGHSVWRACRAYVDRFEEAISKDFHLHFFTDLKREGLVIRAHEWYRQETIWRDWVMVRWEVDDARKSQPQRFKSKECRPDFGDSRKARNKKYAYSPARIHCFFRGPFDDENGENCIYALVEPCAYNHKKSSVFSTEWRLEKKQYLITVDSIVKLCLMIPASLNDPKNDVFHEIWDMSRWPDEFCEVA